MTPKEKALDLIEKFKINDYDWNALGNLYCVKQHALITVNEILDVYLIKNAAFEFYDVRNYYEEVKNEIKNFKL